jgi:hypothetical protein
VRCVPNNPKYKKLKTKTIERDREREREACKCSKEPISLAPFVWMLFLYIFWSPTSTILVKHTCKKRDKKEVKMKKKKKKKIDDDDDDDDERGRLFLTIKCNDFGVKKKTLRIPPTEHALATIAEGVDPAIEFFSHARSIDQAARSRDLSLKRFGFGFPFDELSDRFAVGKIGSSYLRLLYHV